MRGGALLVRNVRPMGGAAVDVLVRDGRIEKMAPGLSVPDATPAGAAGGGIRIADGGGHLLLPGLVNAHAHIDKNLLGYPWHKNQVPGTRIRDLVDYEREAHRRMGVSSRTQSEREVRVAAAYGVTHIRTHVDVDTDRGIPHYEGLLATREATRDLVTMQLVAFPQSGMLVRPGTVELLEQCLKLGADAIGGLDPSTVDRDPVKHLDIVFGLADRYGVEVDVHLHEPGMLGAFSVELIAERTRALGLQGRVTISHTFCLGMVDDAYLGRLIEMLVENRIAIMSLGSGAGPFPPLKRLLDAGVTLCTGSDGIRDTWGPYNSDDMLDRVKMLGYRSGLRRDDDVETLLGIATHGGAKVMGDAGYGLAPGKRADFVVVPGETPTEAVMARPPRALAVKDGRIVAENGVLAAAAGA